MTEETKIQQEAEKYAESLSSDFREHAKNDYIAGASTRIPLLAEIERLKAENEKLKGYIDEIHKIALKIREKFLGPPNSQLIGKIVDNFETGKEEWEPADKKGNGGC